VGISTWLLVVLQKPGTIAFWVLHHSGAASACELQGNEWVARTLQGVFFNQHILDGFADQRAKCLDHGDVRHFKAGLHQDAFVDLGELLCGSHASGFFSGGCGGYVRLQRYSVVVAGITQRVSFRGPAGMFERAKTRVRSGLHGVCSFQERNQAPIAVSHGVPSILAQRFDVALEFIQQGHEFIWGDLDA